MARPETQPPTNNAAIEGVVVTELPPRLREAPLVTPRTPTEPEVPPTTPQAIPIPRVMLPQPPRYPQPPRQGIPPRRVNTAPGSGAGSVIHRPTAPNTLVTPPPQPIFGEAAPTRNGDRGRGVVIGGLAVLLVLGVGATFGLRDKDNGVVTLKAEAPRAPGVAGPTGANPEQPVEPLPEPADLSFLSAKNVSAEPSASTPESPKTPDAKRPTRPVVPNVFPTTPQENTASPSVSSAPTTPKPSPRTTSSAPSPTTSIPTAETPTAEVKIPTAPSLDSVELLNASVNENTVQALDARYENFASYLDLEKLARNGELSGLDISTIQRNQTLINDVYALPGVKAQIGQPNTLSADLLRAMQQANTSPATTLNAHTDTLLRNANSLYPLTGERIVEAAVINDRLVARLTKSLEQGESLSVPLAENATVVKVRTARLSGDVTVAFVASYAEYQYSDKRVAELRWTLLQPVNRAGDFVAATVSSQILKEKKPQTPPTENTPTDTYTTDPAEPTSSTTSPTTSRQTDKQDRQKDRDNRRKNRNRD